MENDTCKPKSYVIGPTGDVLTMDNLPLQHCRRWMPRKKAEVVAAVRGGLLSLDEACERYELTPEEFFTWLNALDHFGMRGLCATDRRKARTSEIIARALDKQPLTVISMPILPLL